MFTFFATQLPPQYIICREEERREKKGIHFNEEDKEQVGLRQEIEKLLLSFFLRSNWVAGQQL